MQRPIRFTAAGDILITRRLPAAGDSALREAIAASDVRLANLETTITDGTRYASAYSGGTWLTADPGCLADVARLGFNVLGFANNHTMDYSYGGLEDTLRFLRREGIAAAGAGQNLFEAARPAIVETPGGRAAVFAVCATFEDAARAGSQTESMPGRPGLNPLRVQTVYRVARPRAQALREAAARTGVNALRQAHRSQGFLPPLPEGTMEFGPVLLEEVESEAQEGRFSRADERDVQRTLEGVRRARAACQAVVVLVHSHEIKAACEEEPDYFLEDFARRCIDAGASAVVGSGTHQVQGIEIYNGCPIFYCLGNFFFENDTVEKLPADFLEKYGVSIHASAQEGLRARAAQATASLGARRPVYQTVLPRFSILDGRCAELELLPVDLGLDGPKWEKGVPRLADARAAEEICAYLNRVSAPYGTRWRVQGQTIVQTEGGKA